MESFGSRFHGHPELTSDPTPSQETERIRRPAPLRTAHCGPGARSWRPPDSHCARLAAARPGARPVPRESALRVSEVASTPRKSPAGRGLLRAPSRESRERFPALRHLPEASVRESTFLGSGPTRLALSVRLRLRCHSGGLHLA